MWVLIITAMLPTHLVIAYGQLSRTAEAENARNRRGNSCQGGVNWKVYWEV